MAWLGSLLTLLTGCTSLAVEQIKVGLSTRADVLHLMGQPESTRKVETGPLAGGDLLEYSSQPEGTQNWLIAVGTDGIVKDVRKLLTPDNFAKVYPGMKFDDVRALLGKPARRNTYAFSPNQHVEWHYQTSPNESMLFIVEVDPQQQVVQASSSRDIEKDK